MFSRCDRTPTGRRTYRRTHDDSIGLYRASIASRGKNAVQHHSPTKQKNTSKTIATIVHCSRLAGRLATRPLRSEVYNVRVDNQPLHSLSPFSRLLSASHPISYT